MFRIKKIGFSLSLAAFLWLFGMDATGLAQSVAPPPKNEMVLLDQPNSQARATPIEMLNRFFEGVKAGKIDDALALLTRDSLFTLKPEGVETLKKGIREALDKYGDVDGFEILEKKTVGDHLLRVTSISLGEDMPLRWRFFFYKGKDTWRLLDMRVDSGIADLFEEEKRAK